MRTVNSLIEKLYQDAKRKMVEKIKDKSSYKELLKNILIQVSDIFSKKESDLIACIGTD